MRPLSGTGTPRIRSSSSRGRRSGRKPARSSRAVAAESHCKVRPSRTRANSKPLTRATPARCSTPAALNAKEIQIDGFGRILYDDQNGGDDNQVNILASNFITGVGGTPTNGVAGTLIKSGPDQVGMAVKDMGGGDFNYLHTSFAKLRVEQGGFRLRNTAAVIDERLFGAVPLATLADAITLDGGGIGSNQTVTLDVWRHHDQQQRRKQSGRDRRRFHARRRLLRSWRHGPF